MSDPKRRRRVRATNPSEAAICISRNPDRKTEEALMAAMALGFFHVRVLQKTYANYPPNDDGEPEEVWGIAKCLTVSSC
ncbi:MAG: hypothetical protein HQL21_09585 [Candidatus Omnitrophica bacterium]|nr:hypothetical protein [Candidatus Omnitrophota bacterium]